MAKRRGKGSAGKSGTTGRAGACALRARRRTSPQERALADVAAVLAGLDAPSAVLGGIAVIAWGFARFTGDIDCAIAAPPEETRALMRVFERRGFSAGRHQVRRERRLHEFDALLDPDRLGDWPRIKRRHP